MSDQATSTAERVIPVIDLGPAAAMPIERVDAQQRPISVLERSIEFALKNNASLDQLQQLLQMKERVDEIDARKSFVEAMAQFKQNPPEILKTKLVEFDTKNNGKTSYLHEELGEICELIVKGLSDVGVSHRWKPHSAEGKFGVSCVLTHRHGHEQDDGPLWAGADTSGGKNSIQAMASTTKYLERYTLLMATGLAPKSMVDDDGRGHKDPAPDWVDEYLDAVSAAGNVAELVAAWKTASGACRRKEARDAYNEIKQRVVERRSALGITDEVWAAHTSEKAA